jgi:hypothetical protein
VIVFPRCGTGAENERPSKEGCEMTMKRFLRIASALTTMAALAVVLGAGHKWGG